MHKVEATFGSGADHIAVTIEGPRLEPIVLVLEDLRRKIKPSIARLVGIAFPPETLAHKTQAQIDACLRDRSEVQLFRLPFEFQLAGSEVQLVVIEIQARSVALAAQCLTVVTSAEFIGRHVLGVGSDSHVPKPSRKP